VSLPRQIAIREYRPGDEAGILALWNRVFARSDPGFRPRDLETWRWLYERNPSGRRIMLAVAGDGRIVSQYAGLGQRVALRGARVRANLAVDSLSDPDRRGLQHPGPFVRTGRVFAPHFGGRSPGSDAFMWGLPDPPAWRIGRTFLGYQVVRNLNRLVRAAAAPAPEHAELSVAEIEAIPLGVEALFERVARERGALVVRDRAHLRWRYFEHPHLRYRMALAGGGDEPRGLAVYRAGAFDGEPTGLLCDWLVPAADEQAADALRAWALGAARGDGLALCAVFPEIAPEFAGFQRAGFRVRATKRTLVARSYRRDLSVDWLRGNWYMTLGDTDLA
jgi:hypothetical protein